MHAGAHHVEALITAGRVEKLGERPGHAADAAADVQHAVVRLEPAEADEVVEELVADRLVIAFAGDGVGPGRERQG